MTDEVRGVTNRNDHECDPVHVLLWRWKVNRAVTGHYRLDGYRGT